MTPKGRKALTIGFQAAMQNEQALFGSMTSDERAELRRLLQVVADNLGLEPGQHPGMTQD